MRCPHALGSLHHANIVPEVRAGIYPNALGMRRRSVVAGRMEDNVPSWRKRCQDQSDILLPLGALAAYWAKLAVLWLERRPLRGPARHLTEARGVLDVLPNEMLSHYGVTSAQGFDDRRHFLKTFLDAKNGNCASTTDPLNLVSQTGQRICDQLISAKPIHQSVNLFVELKRNVDVAGLNVGPASGKLQLEKFNLFVGDAPGRLSGAMSLEERSKDRELLNFFLRERADERAALRRYFDPPLTLKS